jgi:hypothetical protein
MAIACGPLRTLLFPYALTVPFGYVSHMRRRLGSMRAMMPGFRQRLL